ncbi:MAG: PH domain-containing protein [Prevotellaceae bacterium]|jgi:hypothetical protein|nr:PH domain-containing protein [Prevotellaceae bacterium]
MTDAKETTIWEGKPSQWMNFKIFSFCILMTLCIVVALVIAGIKWWLCVFFLYPAVRAGFEWLALRSVKYKLTNRRFIHTEGVFNRITKEIKLNEIREARLIEPWYARIVKIGNLELILDTYSDISVMVEGISEPEKTRNLFGEMLNSENIESNK